ncbi:methionine adenosyltransferase [Candidatus Woesearchaeota archaeon]|nr:methionine adenosyltransferase [Candidatus Woesearchaeota archaeon]
MRRERTLTSESVTEGHPDKVCDQISDSVLDECLRQDPNSRVACESMVKARRNLFGTLMPRVYLMGEITTGASLDFKNIVRRTLEEIRYDGDWTGFNSSSFKLHVNITRQSPDIAIGVDPRGEKDQGAGDQGLMYGYADNETDVLMPWSIKLAHGLVARLSYLRKHRNLDFLGPDGKSQVTIGYRDNGAPYVKKVTIAAQHADRDLPGFRDWILEEVVEYTIPQNLLENHLRDVTIVNGTGKFVVGGPEGDSGLTGRKIIVDTYGGVARHGGGAFSGKDPSKVDRSAAYFARYIAKNIVAAGLAERCEVRFAFTIGSSQPDDFAVETFGTSPVDERQIEKVVRDMFNFRPSSIIDTLELRRPIYSLTAAYGHFGREPEYGSFPWEKTDRASDLRRALA